MFGGRLWVFVLSSTALSACLNGMPSSTGGGNTSGGGNTTGSGNTSGGGTGGSSGTGGGRSCTPPTATASLTSSATLYAGELVEGQGVGITNDPVRCPISSSWWICDAPTESIYFTTANGGCTQVSFTDRLAEPLDKAGTYDLEFRAATTGGLNVFVLSATVIAEPAYFQVTLLDPSVYLSIIDIMTQCTTFGADSCSFYADQGFCVDTTAGCEPPAQVPLDCFAHTTGDACNEDPRCNWLPEVGMCIVDCEGIADEATCEASLCSWSSSTATCGLEMPPIFPGTALARALSDGSQLQLLTYDASGSHRYDPDEALPPGVLPNTEQDARMVGMDFVPEADAAIFVHRYTHVRDSSTPGVQECTFPLAPLYWTPQLGALPLLPSLDGSSATMARVVGYPTVAIDGSGNKARLAFGIEFDSMSLIPCQPPEGPGVGQLFSAYFPFLTGSLAPITSRMPVPLYLAEVDTAGQVKSYPLSAGGATSSRQPCRGSGASPDCNGGTCTAGFCEDLMDIHGYMPRFDAVGERIIFSHATCGTSYGASCSSEGSREYDLIMARVQAEDSGFSIKDATFVASVEGVQELDPLLYRDVSGDEHLLYLGFDRVDGTTGPTSSPIVVERDCTVLPESACKAAGSGACTWDGTLCQNDATGSTTLSVIVPLSKIHRRELVTAGNSWSTIPDPSSDVGLETLVEGSFEKVPVAPFSCRVTSTGGYTRVTEVVETQNPSQFVVTPDGRYLIYTWVKQRTTHCDMPFICLGTCKAELTPDHPVSSDIHIIDLEDAGKPPVSLKNVCSGLDDVVMTPRLIAEGRQVLFTSRSDAASRLMRVNLQEVVDGQCAGQGEVITVGEASAALSQIRPGSTATGVSVEASSTLVQPKPSCAGSDWTQSSWLVVGLLLLARRGWRRQQRARLRSRVATPVGHPQVRG